MTKSKLRHAIGGFAGRQLLNAMFGTVRFKVTTEQPHLDIVKSGSPVVLVSWHGRLLPLAYFHRNQRITAMVSRSGDGEYIARVLAGWNYDSARGSSSRGGSSALREMVKIARGGGSLVLTADGPRGPRQKLKPGVLSAAQLSGSAIIPMTAASSHAWWFEGWDRFLVPKPFSTVYVRYGAPMYVQRNASETEFQDLQQQLETTLNEIMKQADADAQT